jgi:hypothetical protein
MMKKAKRRLCFLSIVIVVAGLVSCHLFDREETLDTVKIYFEQSNVSILGTNGICSLTLTIDPPDVLPYYDVEYKSSNDDVAAVVKQDRRGCVVLGKKLGSVVITAEIGDAVAKAVVNVIDYNPSL